MLGVIVVGFIVSSWYVVPHVAWGLAHGLQMTDRFPDALIAVNPFPFLSFTPTGFFTMAGVVGLVWYRARAWWARPLLLLTLSAYVFRFVAEARFIDTGNTLVFQYTVHVTIATLTAAGVLTLARIGPALLSRLSVSAPTGLGTLAIVVLALWAGTSGW